MTDFDLDARGNEPIARLTRIDSLARRRAAIAAIKAERAKAQPVATEEILAWRHEGHRC